MVLIGPFVRGFAVMAALGLAGCAMGTGEPTTISAAISGIQSDLTKAGVVSVSHVQDWSAAQMSTFDANVRALQCAQKTSDPVVAMIAGPVTMTLSGSFTRSGSFSVSAATTMPVFGLQADASRTHAQMLALPVQFVPLSALPDAEMQREVEYAGALLGQNDAVRDHAAAQIERDRTALAAHIALLVSGYDRAPCSGIVHPFVGARHAP